MSVDLAELDDVYREISLYTDKLAQSRRRFREALETAKRAERLPEMITGYEARHPAPARRQVEALVRSGESYDDWLSRVGEYARTVVVGTMHPKDGAEASSLMRASFDTGGLIHGRTRYIRWLFESGDERVTGTVAYDLWVMEVQDAGD